MLRSPQVKAFFSFLGKFLLIAVPAVIAAFTSIQVSRSEAQANAALGYAEVKKGYDAQEEDIAALQQQVFDLKGQVQILKEFAYRTGERMSERPSPLKPVPISPHSPPTHRQHYEPPPDYDAVMKLKK